MIVWLSSYPRSGNTYLRVVLHHAFGLKTYSLYDDVLDIGADAATAEIVGHAFLPSDWSAADARQDEALWLVKTHDAPQDNAKAIYIIRDGREATASFLNYLRSYTTQDVDLFTTIAGVVRFGSWSEHVHAWNPSARRDTLLIRFEDMVADPEKHIRAIADFLGRELTSNSVPTFADLHAINPTFFRSGQTDSWRSIFDAHHHYLFWLLHYEAMLEYGYDSDMPDVFRRGLTGSEQALAASVRECWKALRQQRAAMLKRHTDELQQQKAGLRELRQQQSQIQEDLKRQGDRLQEYREREKEYQQRLQEQGETLRQQRERELVHQQQLQQQHDELEVHLGREKAHLEQLANLTADMDGLTRQLEAMQRSWSWRITQPLRKIGAGFDAYQGKK